MRLDITVEGEPHEIVNLLAGLQQTGAPGAGLAKRLMAGLTGPLQPGDPVVDPELIAVITAAATAAVGKPVLLRRVRLAGSTPSPVWAETGRRGIHISHRLRKRDQ